MSYRRKKSLLIGINYTNSAHALRGCHSDVDNMSEFLSYRGFDDSQKNRVVLVDRPEISPSSPYYPSGHNLLAAMDWLVSEPGCTLFLHYSGHGGQIADVDGNRSTGIDDTIVPVDFETRGQISSTLLHEHLVTRMAPDCTLFIIMDCCHSGSAVELPFVYRSDSDGQISLLDNLKVGARLVGDAQRLIDGGFSYSKLGEAQHLLAGASSFFKGLRHMGEQEEEGMEAGEFAGQYGSEQKMVTMFSGCRDDQTSADAHIGGEATGAMTWAFLETMKTAENPSYAQVSLFISDAEGDCWLTMTDSTNYETTAGSVELHADSSVEQWLGYRSGKHGARHLTYEVTMYRFHDHRWRNTSQVGVLSLLCSSISCTTL
jgi:hypothetical protein